MALSPTSSSRMTSDLMGLQPVSLDSLNAMNAVDGATIERRIRINRPDEGLGSGSPRPLLYTHKWHWQPDPQVLDSPQAISHRTLYLSITSTPVGRPTTILEASPIKRPLSTTPMMAERRASNAAGSGISAMAQSAM